MQVCHSTNLPAVDSPVPVSQVLAMEKLETCADHIDPAIKLWFPQAQLYLFLRPDFPGQQTGQNRMNLIYRS